MIQLLHNITVSKIHDTSNELVHIILLLINLLLKILITKHPLIFHHTS